MSKHIHTPSASAAYNGGELQFTPFFLALAFYQYLTFIISKLSTAKHLFDSLCELFSHSSPYINVLCHRYVLLRLDDAKNTHTHRIARIWAFFRSILVVAAAVFFSITSHLYHINKYRLLLLVNFQTTSVKHFRLLSEEYFWASIKFDSAIFIKWKLTSCLVDKKNQEMKRKKINNKIFFPLFFSLFLRIPETAWNGYTKPYKTTRDDTSEEGVSFSHHHMCKPIGNMKTLSPTYQHHPIHRTFFIAAMWERAKMICNSALNYISTMVGLGKICSGGISLFQFILH